MCTSVNIDYSTSSVNILRSGMNTHLLAHFPYFASQACFAEEPLEYHQWRLNPPPISPCRERTRATCAKRISAKEHERFAGLLLYAFLVSESLNQTS